MICEKYKHTKFPYQLTDWMRPKKLIKYDEPFIKYEETKDRVIRTNDDNIKQQAIFTTGKLRKNEGEMRNGNVSSVRFRNEVQTGNE